MIQQAPDGSVSVGKLFEQIKARSIEQDQHVFIPQKN